MPGLVPGGTVTMLGGDGGTGKSTLALGLAGATVAGVPWVGRAIEDCGPAAYLSAEDDKDELHRRFPEIGPRPDRAVDAGSRNLKLGGSSQAYWLSLHQSV